MLDAPIWFEIAVVSFIVSVGNILLGHFEEGLPWWRRLFKFLLFLVLLTAISHFAGRSWFFSILGLMVVVVLVIHAWWLPSKGINGWTAEPRDKYHRLRGWTD